MTRTPKPGSDLHRALCAVVRHPDALDSAELAAILWPLPKWEPLPPPKRGGIDEWRDAVNARADAREALRAEAYGGLRGCWGGYRKRGLSRAGERHESRPGGRRGLGSGVRPKLCAGC